MNAERTSAAAARAQRDGAAPSARALAPDFAHAAFPGGIAAVRLPPDTRAAYAGEREQLRFGGAAIVPIALSASLGSKRIVAQTALGAIALTYVVVGREYLVQRLQFADQRMVDPNPSDLQRIEREQLQIDAARNRFSARSPSTLWLRPPVDGPLSSVFGSRRVLNGSPRNPHTGLDFAVPTGTPIRTPLAAEVVAIGDYFFTGNTVFLDHGQGFVTMYCHLSRVEVEAGAMLSEGDPLGRVGATGRATGAHLHWAVFFGNTAVDPALLLAQA